MSEMGINMRYLHLLYHQVDLPYVRDHILADVLARTIKKQFRTALLEIQEGEVYRQSRYERVPLSERNSLLKEAIQ